MSLFTLVTSTLSLGFYSTWAGRLSTFTRVKVRKLSACQRLMQRGDTGWKGWKLGKPMALVVACRPNFRRLSEVRQGGRVSDEKEEAKKCKTSRTARPLRLPTEHLPSERVTNHHWRQFRCKYVKMVCSIYTPSYIPKGMNL